MLTRYTTNQYTQAYVFYFILCFIFYISVTILVSIWDPTMQWNTNSYWICFLGGPEDVLIRSKHVALTSILFYGI